MFFLPGLNVLSSSRVFHSANIAELEEALTSHPRRKRPGRGRSSRDRSPAPVSRHDGKPEYTPDSTPARDSDEQRS